jgi:serine/threonine-protein kinase
MNDPERRGTPPADAEFVPPQETAHSEARPAEHRSGIGLASAATEIGGVEGWIGRVLDDRYRISELLGEGGMGAVFVAEHLKLKKDVALKVIRAELAGNGEVAARFAREAMATAQFEHPHVASAIDYGTLPEGGAYFVMQLVRGRSLRAMLDAHGRLPWRKACELLAQVADALSAARAAGIVHRDLKPENIIVQSREDGSDLVKILDFGIAHVAPSIAPPAPDGQPVRALTRVGAVMGTPGYMSPEQAVGDRIDHRTDLYALGAVLWECIAGRELWDGPDVTTVIARQMSETVPSLRETLPEAGVPEALDACVQRLTARAADARPEHAGTVRDTLRALVAAPDASAPADPARRRLSGRGTARRRAPSRRSLVFLGAGAVLALLLALFAALLRDDHGTPSALDQVVIAATDTLKRTAGVAPVDPLPPDIQRALATMTDSRDLVERRLSAEAVLAFPRRDLIEPHRVMLAELESARTCRDRRAMIAKIEAQGDPRHLPALERMSTWRRSGCGFLDLEDCHSCMRAGLARAIAKIRGASVAPPAPAPAPALAPAPR